MANGRISNSEISDSIKNDIKDMFDTNIKAIIEQHNTIIIDLKDTILDLQTQIKNNNNHNDSNTILYSSMVTKNLGRWRKKKVCLISRIQDGMISIIYRLVKLMIS